MKEKIILGVDGGNTKTDYFLFTAEGTLLHHLRMGTVSHEAFRSFDKAGQLLCEHIEMLCREAKISLSDISCGVFGLAGADTKRQHEELHKRTEQILPGRTFVCNDSVLGLMAAAPDGVGVCCINGTWMSVGGKNEKGELLQVGGIGNVSSDFGGGGHVANEALRHAYSVRYRDHEASMLSRGVLELFGVKADADLMELFHYDNLDLLRYRHDLCMLVFDCAVKGDKAAQEILHRVADTLAASTAGCIKNLAFRGKATIVLAGSLWVKGVYAGMRQRYEEDLRQRLKIPFEIVLLEEPPALGAVLEGYRRLQIGDLTPQLRQKFALAVKQ